MDCKIEWNNLSLEHWTANFNRIRRASLLQSYDYACAAYPARGQTPRWGLIKIEGKEAGLVQIAEASILRGAFHALVLDLGPLWFDSEDICRKENAFFKELNRQFPKRLGRKRRIIPGFASDVEMKQCGFTYQEGSSYETLWLDLTQEEGVLRKNLHQKWRNQLNKSEKQDFDFKVDYRGESLKTFTPTYAVDINFKKYKNIKPAHINAYFKVFSANKACFFSYALKNNTVLASAFILMHGTSATYQIGLLEDVGRPLCANHFLLWNVMMELKKRKIKDFDLGGVNAYDVKDIQHFKEGLNGEKTTNSGIYS